MIYFVYLCDIMKMFWFCEQNFEYFIELILNILLSDIKNDVDQKEILNSL